MRARHALIGTSLALATALLAGCGADVDTSGRADAPGYPVTVTNCGHELTVDAPPQRTVVNDVNMTDMMFALGLEDHLAGYVLGGGVRRDAETGPWKDGFDSVPQLGEKINKEMIQGANADMVFAGWNYGFSESSGVTPEALRDVGIPSYILTESCRQDDSTARGIMDPIDALYTDLTNLGEIYGVPERAESLIDGYKKQIADVKASVPADRPSPRVFLYDSGTDQPLTVGTNAAANAVITKAGGENIFADLDDSWTKATFETAADRDPDVILICDYGDGPADTVEAKEDFLRGHPLMAGTSAVKENRFFALPYSALTESPRNPQAIADFAGYLNSLGR